MMGPKDGSGEKVKAATDAVFEEGTPVEADDVTPGAPPDQAAAPQILGGEAVADPEVSPEKGTPDAAREASPPQAGDLPPAVGDYVRELGQEFQEQEEEGKL